MNEIFYFEIQVNEPEKSVEFYSNVFGWKFTKVDNLPIEYYRIETNGISGGLYKRPGNLPPQNCGNNAFICSIKVENFDKISEIILKNGGTVALPKFAVFGKCWQGYFLDAQNNTFGIFEVDENAK